MFPRNIAQNTVLGHRCPRGTNNIGFKLPKTKNENKTCLYIIFNFEYRPFDMIVRHLFVLMWFIYATVLTYT